MVAPTTSAIADQFGIKSSVVKQMVVSIFVLGYSFGPLFIAPLSELYGRKRVMQCANLFYIVWNTACALSQSASQIVAFRFLAGLGASAPWAIEGGIIGDTWRTEERGQAVALASLAPLLGPALGPIAGAWIVQRTTWRWVFWSTSIISTIIQIVGAFFMEETYAPVLLERKAKKLRRDLELDTRGEKRNSHWIEVRTSFQTDEKRWRPIFIKAITRPFKFFASEPIIQVLGLYMAFVYGIMFITLTTIPPIFELIYHQPSGIAGLHYIALGLGLVIASQINARCMDRVYIFLKAKYGGVGRPEFRLPSMVPGTILLPIGVLLTGWGPRTHWIVPDIGITFIGAGDILNYHSIQSYVIDAYSPCGFAASALATVSFLLSLAGFSLPLLSPAMYDTLGYGWGNTVLAGVAVVVGCPAPWIFWRFGERIRERSKHAS